MKKEGEGAKMEKILIKTMKDGRPVTVEGGFICVASEKETCRVEKLTAREKADAEEYFPGFSFDYRAHRVLLSAEEGEKAKTLIDTFLAEKKSKEQQDRLALEASLPQHRMLVKSGHYYMDEEIATVVLQPEKDQEKYSEWLRGKAVMGSIKPNKISVGIKTSKTAQTIVKSKSSGLQYGTGESIMWVITPDQEAQIVAECREAEEAKNQSEEKDKAIVQEKRKTIFDKAASTEEKQALKSWVTQECSEGLDDCSFDAATEWAMPDGTPKTTYTHCH